MFWMTDNLWFRDIFVTSRQYDVPKDVGHTSSLQ